MTNQTTSKQTDVSEILHPLLENRWSPRAFDGQALTEEEMKNILQGARWAASSMNEQPWMYYYSLAGTEGFEQLFDCLMPGNQPWCKNAGALIVATRNQLFTKNGKKNVTADHDLGMANAQLSLQALHQNVYCHFIGGFDRAKTNELLNLPEGSDAICMIALGRMGTAEDLEEPYLSREKAARSRKSISEIAKHW